MQQYNAGIMPRSAKIAYPANFFME